MKSLVSCQSWLRYMYLRTKTPKAIPMKVAIEMPKMPARIPGTTKELQPLAVAIPQAVVGPPTLALEAISIRQQLSVDAEQPADAQYQNEM